MQEGFQLIARFLKSRRHGLSLRTLEFYRGYLSRAREAIGFQVKGQDIVIFLDRLSCSNGGRHAYYRALRAFYNWAYSPKSGFCLNPQRNPVAFLDAPKVERPIPPSLTVEQVNSLLQQVDKIRDKAIIALLADSGMRLREIANIKAKDIDWASNTVTIWGKGNKQRKAPFTEGTARPLSDLISQNGTGDNIWQMKPSGIATMLRRLEERTGLKCNPHTFRRTFASNLHRAGLDVEHIMRLGGWESLDMVLRYTRSVKFEDSLRFYRQVTKDQ